MATSAPTSAPNGPGQVHGEHSKVIAEAAVCDQPQNQVVGPAAPGIPCGEQSGPQQAVKSQLSGGQILSGQSTLTHLIGNGPGVVLGGPQVSVAGHVQHVSVAGQVQQAGTSGEVIVTGGGNGGVTLSGEGDDLPQKRKATSFKITNVFLSRPPSNDGDDSCDDNEDLEDSHTEGAYVAINISIM